MSSTAWRRRACPRASRRRCASARARRCWLTGKSAWKCCARGFADASLYGADQIGGAHVLHVLKYPLDRYELPENPEVSATVAMTQVMKPITGALAALPS